MIGRNIGMTRRQEKIKLIKDSLKQGEPLYVGDRKLNVFEMCHILSIQQK